MWLPTMGESVKGGLTPVSGSPRTVTGKPGAGVGVGVAARGVPHPLINKPVITSNAGARIVLAVYRPCLPARQLVDGLRRNGADP